MLGFLKVSNAQAHHSSNGYDYDDDNNNEHNEYKIIVILC